MAEPARPSGPAPTAYRAPNAVTLLSVGSAFGVCVAIFVFLGVFLDDAVGTSPLFALLGVAIGIVSGSVGAYAVIRPYLAGGDRSTPSS